MTSDRSFQLLEVEPSRMENSPAVGRPNWPDETKARIVEEALAPNVNVSAIARRYEMTPSQLFCWRRKAIAKGEVQRREGSGEDAGTLGGVIAAHEAAIAQMNAAKLADAEKIGRLKSIVALLKRALRDTVGKAADRSA